MQELVDSFADAIKEKGASELKDLGIEKLQEFLVEYGYSTAHSKAIAEFLTSGKTNDINERIEVMSGLSGAVEVKIDKRSVMSYFLDPIIKGFGESLKER